MIVAIARAALAFTLGLTFWAAAPAVLGWQPTTVMTASMAPAIAVGDVVVAAPADRSSPVVGRVLLAVDPDRPDRLRLHRLESVRPNGLLVTRGDANAAADSTPLQPDAVRGVGVLRVPWVGLPAVWVRTGEVVPLAVTLAGLVLSLAVALRRGVDDDSDAPTPPRDDTAHARPRTRRALRARSAGTRRFGRTLGFIAAFAAAVVAVSTPASASFSEVSAASGTVSAGRVSEPRGLGCYNDGGAVVTWAYDGREPRSFDLLIDGRVVIADIPPWFRAARVPHDGSYSLFRTDRVTVRTNVGRHWSAESGESAPVGGVLLGFGRPYCR